MIGSSWFESPELGCGLSKPFPAPKEMGEIGSGDRRGGSLRGPTGQGHGILPGCTCGDRGRATAPGSALSGGLTSCFSRLSLLVGRGPFCPLVRLGDAWVPLQSGVGGGSGLHGSMSLSSLE